MGRRTKEIEHILKNTEHIIDHPQEIIKLLEPFGMLQSVTVVRGENIKLTRFEDVYISGM
jgi:hypothetical protein